MPAIFGSITSFQYHKKRYFQPPSLPEFEYEYWPMRPTETSHLQACLSCSSEYKITGHFHPGQDLPTFRVGYKRVKCVFRCFMDICPGIAYLHNFQTNLEVRPSENGTSILSFVCRNYTHTEPLSALLNFPNILWLFTNIFCILYTIFFAGSAVKMN